ncbi:MAG: hypothetical protein IKA30_02800 [Alphaproteobacteria bacterium]|nr:hypothetical protein [Alphaproteobacteria bacterium]
MIKLFFLIFNICLFSSNSYANEEGVLSLFDGEPQVQSKQTQDKEKNQDENSENKDSFFSFMDLKMPENIFSSSPTSSSDKTEDKKPETFEDTVKLADKGDLKSQLAV